ncbi:MAG: hypothetical protein ABFD06_13630 [Smithella sp.]
MAEATNKTERPGVNEWAHSEPENRPEVTPQRYAPEELPDADREIIVQQGI